MPRNQYSRMTNREVLWLIREGIYSANLETGIVINRHGNPMSSHSNSNASETSIGHRYVKLYFKFKDDQYKARNIFVHQLVWMVGTNSVIPKGWEIHHIDLDVEHNAFTNLICLHPVDHRKFHTIDSDDEEVPF